MINKSQILPRLHVTFRRLLATAVDGSFIFVAMTGITALIAFTVILVKGTPAVEELQLVFHGVPTERLESAWYWAIAKGIAPYVMALSPAVWWLYELLFSVSKLQSTPGKWICQLKTVSIKTRRAYFGEAALRSGMKVMTLLSLLFIASPIFLLLVFALLVSIPVFSKHGQFLHDLIPGTNVLTKANWMGQFSIQPA